MSLSRKITGFFALFFFQLAAACEPESEPDASQPAASTGWETASPDEIGIDGAMLAALADDIHAGEYLNIHSLLVVRDGQLVMEEYFEGEDERRGLPVGVISFDADTLHDARSVTKSVVSIAFGAAIADGSIKGTDLPVLDYFPEYQDLRTPEREAIILSHILSMTSGFEWDESSVIYGEPLNDETAMDRSPDPYRYVMEQQVVFEPGTKWEYSGGDTMLMAGVIEKATGTGLEAYTKQAVFEPLGITQYEWLTYSDGTPISASGLRLLPRDMAKIGLLYLNGGRWNDVQVVPEDWVEASLSPQAFIGDRPTGFQRYGYQWWLGTARVGEDYVPFATAVGWGGQRILMVPSMDLVIVVTAGMYGDRRQTGITFEIMLDRVLPAVKN